MSEINRVALFGKLNEIAYKGIESATVFCKMRGNPYVELVHWVNQILQLPDSDLHRWTSLILLADRALQAIGEPPEAIEQPLDVVPPLHLPHRPVRDGDLEIRVCREGRFGVHVQKGVGREAISR